MDSKHALVVAATMLAAMAASPASGQDQNDPYIRLADIEIDPAQVEAYRVAIKEQIEAATRLEPGVLVYSISDKANPARIVVFEMYASTDAYKAHLETAHFKKYKITTQQMVKSLKLRDMVPILLGAKS